MPVTLVQVQFIKLQVIFVVQIYIMQNGGGIQLEVKRLPDFSISSTIQVG